MKAPQRLEIVDVFGRPIGHSPEPGVYLYAVQDLH